MRVIKSSISSCSIRSETVSRLTISKPMGLALIILASFFNFGPAPAQVVDTVTTRMHETRQAKIEAYKAFKRQYEDKDFKLSRRFFTRTKTLNGTSAVSRIAIYQIEYGTIADNQIAYNRNCDRILRTPTRSESTHIPACDTSFFVERYDESGLHPAIHCMQPDAQSYPVSLIFEHLSEEELKHVVLINDFNEGDAEIQFAFDKATDGQFVQKVFDKLQAADEKNDRHLPPTQMSPIIPSAHQRISIAYLDGDNNGEPDHVLLPYCVNGSYFDQDPYNNAVQVALKYPLITKSDLALKAASDQPDTQKRLGLWKWDRPTEILISFCDNPGPDIVFYDLGKVVNGRIIDPEPDGEFDLYEFLY